MAILKAIGAFFARIWRWIKETAWIQPLLIVGTIFAIIFSIPYITKWVESFSSTNTNAFYTAKKQTLEGEVLEFGNVTSAADKITDSIYQNTLATLDGDDSTNPDTSKYGKKFFLLYVNSDDSTSTGNEDAFRYLEDYWGEFLIPSDGASKFTYYTIFEDDTSSNDGDYEETFNDTFARYLYNNELFDDTVIEDHLKSAPYAERANLRDEENGYYDKLFLHVGSESWTSFPVPSVLLIDYSEEAIEKGRAGLCEALFSLSGEDSDKAKTLMNMWNHLDPYDADNLFTEMEQA